MSEGRECQAEGRAEARLRQAEEPGGRRWAGAEWARGEGQGGEEMSRRRVPEFLPYPLRWVLEFPAEHCPDLTDLFKESLCCYVEDRLWR